MKRSPRDSSDSKSGPGGRGRGRSATAKPARARKREEKGRCRFCRAEMKHPELNIVDFKDVVTLKKLVTSQGKIFSRKRSGNCARHQSDVKSAIKLARFMSLMPYIGG